MPKGVRVRQDLEAMIELVIKERRIALPASRLWWYARWFGIPVSRQHVGAVCRMMEKDGRLLRIEDGKYIYWKLRYRTRK